MPTPDFLTLLDGTAPDSAIHQHGRSISYAELGPSVRAMASGLAQQGISPGDRAAVMLPNSADAVEAYLAVAMVGAIWVGLNTMAPLAERDRQCELVKPEVIIADPLSAWEPAAWRVVGVAELRDGADLYEGPRPDLDEPCAIGFSSGTTGLPKALVHSRRAVSLTASVYAHARLQSDDRVGVILPMSIHNLIVVGVLPALFAGATCVPVERMNASGVAEATAEHRLTLLNALVPATIYDLVHDERITRETLASLRYAGTGAAGLAETLREEFEQKFQVALAGSYGMTEAPGVVCAEDSDAAHIPGASGRPLPHVEVAACDGAGRVLPSRTEGELIVGPRRSGEWAGCYAPALGAWTTAGLQRRSLQDRVLRTGDYGWVDDGGTVFVTGRKADVLVRGGVNVNAAELESVLRQLPLVRDIAVVGEPDHRLGQRIVAYVEPTGGESLDPEVLREQARGVLAHGKVPDEFIAGTLPRNAMGKVARGQLTRSVQ